MIDRATLAQTARDVAGGGSLLGLRELAGGRWHATVSGPGGRRAVVLDPLLGTVLVHPLRRWSTRYRGSPGCTMGACPPRSRRPA
ncbi:MAG: hypothetical protein M3P44_03565 [Actinomycetota bacterium]|nr:hypothetical protein [Actinomycetota bacterium]